MVFDSAILEREKTILDISPIHLNRLLIVGLRNTALSVKIIVSGAKTENGIQSVRKVAALGLLKARNK